MIKTFEFSSHSIAPPTRLFHTDYESLPDYFPGALFTKYSLSENFGSILILSHFQKEFLFDQCLPLGSILTPGVAIL